MRQSSRVTLFSVLATLALAALFSRPALASSLVIPEGRVFSVTDASNTVFPIDLPAGFF